LKELRDRSLEDCDSGFEHSILLTLYICHFKLHLSFRDGSVSGVSRSRIVQVVIILGGLKINIPLIVPTSRPSISTTTVC
jgi:hypothetical protein